MLLFFCGAEPGTVAGRSIEQGYTPFDHVVCRFSGIEVGSIFTHNKILNGNVISSHNFEDGISESTGCTGRTGSGDGSRSRGGTFDGDGVGGGACGSDVVATGRVRFVSCRGSHHNRAGDGQAVYSGDGSSKT